MKIFTEYDKLRGTENRFKLNKNKKSMSSEDKMK